MFNALKILVFIISISGLSGAFASLSFAVDDDMQAGRAALEAKEYLKAFKIISKIADQGDAEAQYTAALVLQNFTNKKEVAPLIVAYLSNAANQNHPAAQDLLASYYMRGEGVEQDRKMAFELYKVAIDGGFEKAACHLVSLMEDNYDNASVEELTSIKVRFSEIIDWAFIAVDNGKKSCPSANNFLGDAYTHGLGMPKNIKVGLLCYTRAAANENAHAQTSLANAFFTGLGVDMNKEKARFLFEKAAKQGDKEALFNLGVMQEQGVGGFQADQKLALGFYLKAAKKGDDLALNRLGQIYSKNINSKEDTQKIYFLYYLLAKNEFKSNHSNPEIYTAAQRVVAILDAKSLKDHMGNQRENADTCLATRFKTCDFSMFE